MIDRKILRKFKRGYVVSLLGILGVFGVLSFWSLGRDRTAEAGYLTSRVERNSISNSVSATGTLQAVRTVQVGSQVSGQVEALFADYNSIVKKGQLLARIDPRTFQTQVSTERASVGSAQARLDASQADVSTAQANLLQAQASLQAEKAANESAAAAFDRAQQLLNKGLIAKSDYDIAKSNADSAAAKVSEAEAAITQVQSSIASKQAQIAEVRSEIGGAKAGLERAALSLELTNIYSPIDGIVISRNVDVGQTVAASLSAPTLFVIANDLTEMQVKASVDEADIGKIAQGAPVEFTVDAYPKNTFHGVIDEIRLDPQTVQNVVTYNVMVRVSNTDLKLKPGMTANIMATVASRENVLTVPNAALRFTPAAVIPQNAGTTARKSERSKATVWTLDDKGQPRAVAVRVGITDGVRSEVIDPELGEGAVVIVGSMQQSPAAATKTPTATPSPFAIGGAGAGRRGFR